MFLGYQLQLKNVTKEKVFMNYTCNRLNREVLSFVLRDWDKRVVVLPTSIEMPILESEQNCNMQNTELFLFKN